VRGVVPLRRVQHLEAQVAQCDLPVLDEEELLAEGPEIVLYLHQQIGGLLQRYVQLSAVTAKAILFC